MVIRGYSWSFARPKGSRVINSYSWLFVVIYGHLLGLSALALFMVIRGYSWSFARPKGSRVINSYSWLFVVCRSPFAVRFQIADCRLPIAIVVPDSPDYCTIGKYCSLAAIR